jgi:hypothetical protein
MSATQHMPTHGAEHRAVLPRSAAGRISAGLLVAFVALLVWLVVGVNTGGLEPGTSLARTLGVVMLTSGVATIVAASVARWRAHDRSWSVIGTLVVPAIVVLAFAIDLVLNALTG